MNKDREKLIGARLRAFRETLQIPRTKFAVTLGISSERLASYESGRAALPYEVFRSISKHYQLNPEWLAHGEAVPKLIEPFNDEVFISQLKPRDLFSEVYSMYIEAMIKQHNATVNMELKFIIAALEKLDAFYLNDAIPLKTRLRVYKQFWPSTSAAIDKVTGRVAKSDEINEPLKALENKISERDLTDVESSSRLEDVKPQLPSLLERLQKATQDSGQKSALAKSLDVPLASVSRWLAGDREPGGEITLKLLKWVEQQERK